MALKSCIEQKITAEILRITKEDLVYDIVYIRKMGRRIKTMNIRGRLTGKIEQSSGGHDESFVRATERWIWFYG